MWTELEPYSATPLPQGVYLAMESRIDHMIEGYDRSYLFYGSEDKEQRPGGPFQA